MQDIMLKLKWKHLGLSCRSWSLIYNFFLQLTSKLSSDEDAIEFDEGEEMVFVEGTLLNIEFFKKFLRNFKNFKNSEKL